MTTAAEFPIDNPERSVGATGPKLLAYVFSDEQREAQPLAAAAIVAAILHGREVNIRNARIEGAFTLDSRTIDSKITIEESWFVGPLDCTYATFKHTVSFKGSAFADMVTFRAATFEKELYVDQATFAGKVDFSNVGAFEIFCNSARFEKELVLDDFSTAKSLQCTECIFGGQATISGNVGGGASFRKARFDSKAHFPGLHVGRRCRFEEARFKGRVSFAGAQFEANTSFHSAIFEGEADFVSVRAIGTVVFNAVEFKQKTSFASAQFEAEISFASATFEGDADFALLRVKGAVAFTGAKFKKGASFAYTRVELRIDFAGATFEQSLDLHDAYFGTINFGGDQVLKATVDLRGASYNRLIPAEAWLMLTKRLTPYDRQPYTQLETIFNVAGMDNLANQVYIARKKREASLIPKRNLAGLCSDRFLRWFTGYGVKLRRLWWAILPILAVGLFVFLLPGSVVITQTETFPVGVIQQAEPCMEPKLGWTDAFFVSLDAFLPINLPIGETLKPSRCPIVEIPGLRFAPRFVDVANIMAIMGWILVPVGLAGLAGILKR